MEQLDFPIFKDTFGPEWERPYNFCYSGTNLNPSRAYTADLLAVRPNLWHACMLSTALSEPCCTLL
jgi:hypothetical protein